MPKKKKELSIEDTRRQTRERVKRYRERKKKEKVSETKNGES